MARERIQIIEEFIAESDLTSDLKRVALANAYYSAAILRYFSKSVSHRKYLRKAFVIRRGFVENARLVEIIYLSFIPVSETVWRFAKSFFRITLKRL